VLNLPNGTHGDANAADIWFQSRLIDALSIMNFIAQITIGIPRTVKIVCDLYEVRSSGSCKCSE